ncbi:transposase-like protein, partial [Kroppenstedtia sanguinis]
MAKKGQTFKRYTLKTKAEAIRLRLEEGLSYRSICERLSVRSKSQIQDWV